MYLLAVLASAGTAAPPVPAQAPAESAGLVLNVFWIAVAAANFLLLLFLLQQFAFGPIGRILEDRRARIVQGLEDSEEARVERERAQADRDRTLNEARREAADLMARAQKAAQELRDQDIAATREELERLRERAAADIEAERQRALADLRAQVADLALAAAGKVVSESMTDARQRRLVEQFLEETGTNGKAGS